MSETYILDLARAAQIAPLPRESLAALARRCIVHEEYAEAYLAPGNDDRLLSEADKLFHAARAACCRAIIAAAEEAAEEAD